MAAYGSAAITMLQNQAIGSRNLPIDLIAPRRFAGSAANAAGIDRKLMIVTNIEEGLWVQDRAWAMVDKHKIGKSELMKIFVAIGLIIISAGAAQAQSAGDWVLARFKNGEFWYPGVIQRVSGDRLTITYDDGDRETMPISAVRPYNWAIGSLVQCNFRGTGKWYPGRISSLGGTSLGVDYDDGDKERTTTGRCRSV